jgi:hypothetical protein
MHEQHIIEKCHTKWKWGNKRNHFYTVHIHTHIPILIYIHEWQQQQQQLLFKAIKLILILLENKKAFFMVLASDVNTPESKNIFCAG